MRCLCGLRDGVVAASLALAVIALFVVEVAVVGCMALGFVAMPDRPWRWR